MSVVEVNKENKRIVKVCTSCRQNPNMVISPWFFEEEDKEIN